MRVLSLVLLFCSSAVFADTIANYMNIANNIPKMQLKADEQSQAWARSARNVIIITTESIAETMIKMNQAAASQGAPLFCLPDNVKLDAKTLDELIQNTAKTQDNLPADFNNMTVSEVAWLAVKKAYPCRQMHPVAQNAFDNLGARRMQHISSDTN